MCVFCLIVREAASCAVSSQAGLHMHTLGEKSHEMGQAPHVAATAGALKAHACCAGISATGA